jgi:hypothetical protein
VTYKRILEFVAYHEGRARAIRRFVESVAFFKVADLVSEAKIVRMIQDNNLERLKELASGTAMSIRELKDEARILGIVGYSTMNKQELIESVLTAKEQQYV